jgi:hypothetical protein
VSAAINAFIRGAQAVKAISLWQKVKEGLDMGGAAMSKVGDDRQQSSLSRGLIRQWRLNDVNLPRCEPSDCFNDTAALLISRLLFAYLAD